MQALAHNRANSFVTKNAIILNFIRTINIHRETEDAIYIISSLNYILTLYLTPDQSINHTIVVTDTIIINIILQLRDHKSRFVLFF
jgi:hypothetical protein